jgi:DNA repair protein RadC
LVKNESGETAAVAARRAAIRARIIDPRVTFSTPDLLEAALYQLFPQKDTAPTAHALITAYGSLQTLFAADVNALAAVPGMTWNAAVHLKVLTDLFVTLHEEGTQIPTAVNTPQDAAVLVRHLLRGREREQLIAVALSGTRVIGHRVVAEGGFSAAHFRPRAVLDTIVPMCASGVIFAHNHPSGRAKPSADDIAATRTLVGVLHTAGIAVYDHLIVTRAECYSVAQGGLITQADAKFTLTPLREDFGLYRKGSPETERNS